MIISKGRRYIFVHIPKTGGTSMALALEARAKRDDILIGDTPKAKRRHHRQKLLGAKGRLWKHSTLADIDGLVETAELDQMFIFTMVRNPWDRAVSYYHWLRAQQFNNPSVVLARSLSFPDFLRQEAVQRAFQSNPACSYMQDAAGRGRADLYIRLEHVVKDAEPLEAHLGFRFAVPHVNASARAQDYRRCYSTDTAEIIAHTCRGDIEQFGYAFDPAK